MGPVFSDGIGAGDDVDIKAIRAKIVDLICARFPELQPYARAEPAKKIQTPAAMAYPIDRVTYDETFDEGATIVMPVRLYLTQEPSAVDQDALDDYITPRGPKSVPQYMHRNHPTLDDLVMDARIREARNYGLWPVAQVSFLGIEFMYEIRV